MHAIDLSRYRKLVAAVLTISALYLLKQFGLDFGELTALGLDPGPMVEGMTDFLITVGIPGLMLWLFPQDTDGFESEAERRDQNRRLIIFAGAVIALVAIVGGLVWLL